jgi:hypothetical protein
MDTPIGISGHYTFKYSGEHLSERLCSHFSLYNRPNFLQRKKLIYHHHYLEDNSSGQVAAYCAFIYDESGTAVNGEKLPFAGIEINPALPLQALDYFVGSIKNQLIKQGLTRGIIKLPPSFYNPGKVELLESILIGQGFKRSGEMIYHFIPVSDAPFESLVHQMEYRKLKKLSQQGFHPEVFSHKDFNVIFSFVASCRKEKSFGLAIDRKELHSMVRAYPDHYQFFGIYSKNELAAATIFVLPDQAVGYNFLPASSRKYQSYSPMVLLYKTLYEFCQRKGIASLDLGSSMLGHAPNESLITFKEHMGGIRSHQYQWIWSKT